MGLFPKRKDPVFLRGCGKGPWAGAGVTGEVGPQAGFTWGAVAPQAWGTLFPASSAPETVKLIKAVEPQD